MYCRAEDVKGEVYLPLLAQISAKYGAEADAFFEGHIRRADDYIDTVLVQAFDVPFDPVPRVVQTISAKLAAFYATARFSEKEEISKDKHDSALEMLDALVKSGKLPGSTASAPEEGAPRLRVGSEPRWFDERRLRLL